MNSSNKHIQQDGFDLGMLIPAYNEWDGPLYSIWHWLKSAEVLEEQYRILILILVNGPTPEIPENRHTLGLMQLLGISTKSETNDIRRLVNIMNLGKYLVRQILKIAKYHKWSHEDNYIMSTAKDVWINTEAEIWRNLHDNEKCLLIHLKSLMNTLRERVTIVIQERYQHNNTIGDVRHIGFSWLKAHLHAKGILISTDADTFPTNPEYFQSIIQAFNKHTGIFWMTGGYRVDLPEDASERTKQYYQFEQLCHIFHKTFIYQFAPSQKRENKEKLSLMPGSNTIVRAHVYDTQNQQGEILQFPLNAWTGEDMEFSRRLLESWMSIIRDEALSVTADYRPSNRTEYGHGTEIHAINESEEFLVQHPLAISSHFLVYAIFLHSESIDWWEITDRNQYICDCLKETFGNEIISEELENKLKEELRHEKWLMIWHPTLNDTALRMVINTVKLHYHRLSIIDAYKWMITYAMDQLKLCVKQSYYAQIYTTLETEFERLEGVGTNIEDHKSFLVNIFSKIYSINQGHYTPIPVPEMHSEA